MSDSPEEFDEQMYIIYDPVTEQVTQVVYETAAHGNWTRINKNWFPLSVDDISTFVLERRTIAPKSYLETRDYFDDQTEQKVLTYEPEYRMWFA